MNSKLSNPGYCLNKVFDESAVALEDIVITSGFLANTEGQNVNFDGHQTRYMECKDIEKQDFQDDSGISDGKKIFHFPVFEICSKEKDSCQFSTHLIFIRTSSIRNQALK